MPAARMSVPAHSRVENIGSPSVGCMDPQHSHHLLKLQTQVPLLLICRLKTIPLEIRHAGARQALCRQQPPLAHSAGQLPPCVRGTIVVKSVHLDYPDPKLILCIHSISTDSPPVSVSLMCCTPISLSTRDTCMCSFDVDALAWANCDDRTSLEACAKNRGRSGRTHTNCSLDRHNSTRRSCERLSHEYDEMSCNPEIYNLAQIASLSIWPETVRACSVLATF